MTKTLIVTKPFSVMEPGDTLELNKDGMYESTYNEENHETNDEDGSVYSTYNSSYAISPDYAIALIKKGYLKTNEPKEKKNDTPFINVFDEIDNMIEAYNDDLKNLDDDMADQPKALKVEKETVLKNLVKALNHLKNLKK